MPRRMTYIRLGWLDGESCPMEKDELIERVRRRFEKSAPARIFRDDEIEDGLAYDVEDRGDEARISVGPRTEFGRGVYDKISSEESLRTVVDLMLMSMGYSEFVDCKQIAERHRALAPGTQGDIHEPERVLQEDCRR